MPENKPIIVDTTAGVRVAWVSPTVEKFIRMAKEWQR